MAAWNLVDPGQQGSDETMDLTSAMSPPMRASPFSASTPIMEMY